MINLITLAGSGMPGWRRRWKNDEQSDWQETRAERVRVGWKKNQQMGVVVPSDIPL